MSDDDFVKEYKAKGQAIFRLMKDMTAEDARKLLEWCDNCICTCSYVDIDKAIAARHKRDEKETEAADESDPGTA